MNKEKKVPAGTNEIDESQKKNFSKSRKSKQFPNKWKSKPYQEDKVIKDGRNAVSWYGSPEVIKLAGNLSFFKPLGSKINNFYQVQGTYDRDTVPGIMTINVMSALPITGGASETDAINLAARQQFALIRKANSGSKNYEWNDLIVYEMARSAINEIYAFLVRAYGVCMNYSMLNRYTPKAILTSMGFDSDDFIANIASIRLYLNNLALRINSMALPHSLTYFERKAWLYSNVYTDNSSAKAQIYMLNPDNGKFLFYDPTASVQGGCLIPRSIFANGNEFADWRVEVDAFVDALLSDDDCATISGDILKAYGDSNLFKCNVIDEQFKLEPVYNTEVLEQFENLTTSNGRAQALSTDTGDSKLLHEGAILQDGAGNLIFDPYFDAGTTTAAAVLIHKINPILNFHNTDVTPEQVMVGTRLTTTFDGAYRASDGTGNYFIGVSACGTEIVTSMLICRLPTVSHTVVYTTNSSGGSAVSLLGKIYEILDLSAFDWAPKYYLYNSYTSSYILPFGDLDTYRVVTEIELHKLHDTATLYMFGVPLIDNYNKSTTR